MSVIPLSSVNPEPEAETPEAHVPAPGSFDNDKFDKIVGAATKTLAENSGAPLLVIERLTDALAAITAPKRRVAIRNEAGDIVEMLEFLAEDGDANER